MINLSIKQTVLNFQTKRPTFILQFIALITNIFYRWTHGPVPWSVSWISQGHVARSCASRSLLAVSIWGSFPENRIYLTAISCVIHAEIQKFRNFLLYKSEDLARFWMFTPISCLYYPVLICFKLWTRGQFLSNIFRLGDVFQVIVLDHEVVFLLQHL